MPRKAATIETTTTATENVENQESPVVTEPTSTIKTKAKGVATTWLAPVAEDPEPIKREGFKGERRGRGLSPEAVALMDHLRANTGTWYKVAIVATPGSSSGAWRAADIAFTHRKNPDGEGFIRYARHEEGYAAAIAAKPHPRRKAAEG